MGKTLWTKGVWYVTETLEGEFRVRQLSSDAVIASIEDGGHYGEELIEWDEREANARLIAAAPEYDELLSEAIDIFEGDLTGVEWKRAWRDLTHRAKALRAKARGEQ